MIAYNRFLQEKSLIHEKTGFLIHKKEINPILFEFQKDIVKWNLEKGKSAIFLDCGMGKTFIQLEWANQIHKKENKPVLILAPLAVSHQTVNEGKKLNLDVNIAHDDSQITNGINITNYEKLHNFNPNRFIAVVLDESSILKSYSGKIRNQIIESFNNTPYKLACTATPAPNDFMELGNHSEFLNNLSRSEMLSMYFIHDGGDTAKWRLKGHAQDKFWGWVASWSIILTNPNQLGYVQDGFDLPELNIIEHVVKTNKKLDGELFIKHAQTLDERRQARKESISERVAKAKELMTNENWLVWCDFNAESELLRKELEAVEVKGADNDSHKESAFLGFANGEVKRLVTKPKIGGFGMNWQNCNNMIFCGLSDSYEQFYQAVRRCYRFGQKQPVNVHIIISDIEGSVLQNIKRKEKDAKTMQDSLIASVQEIEKLNLRGHINMEVKYSPKQIETDDYKLFLGDAVEVARLLPSDSIPYSIFSPPFASLYTYSDSDRDMGNSKSYDEFLEHYEYLVAQQARITMPGRLLSFHCMNIPLMKERDGVIGLKDFKGDLIRLYQKYGFIWHSEVMIRKDPLIEATRTKTLGLLHKQLQKDSAMSRQGIPDYLVTMRKDGENPHPITKSEGFTRYIGTKELVKASGIKNSHQIWRRYAEPVWDDIDQSDTLQFRTAKTEKDEKHICPLQLQVIERGIELWSNKGEVVFSPFMGIGSEGYTALKMGRKFYGVELKESYFNLAEKNMRMALEEKQELVLNFVEAT